MLEFLAVNFNLPTLLVAAVVFGGTGWLLRRAHKAGGGLLRYDLHLFYRFRRYRSDQSQHVCLLVSLHQLYEPCTLSSIF